MEIYKGRLIAYSLGNFATYGAFKLEDELALGCILKVKLSAKGELLEAKVVSTIQDKQGDAWALGITPSLDPEDRAAALVEKLSVEDFGMAVSSRK